MTGSSKHEVRDNGAERIGSLCSGYGGLDLGLMAVVGGSVAWHVEYDKHPSAVLDARFPGVPNYGDLTTTDWTQVEPVDWLTAGYPCQPFSHAGKRKGSADERHLWPFVADAIGALRPRRVLLENVAGHVSLGLDAVLWDLAALGYDATWGVVRAADAGAPHNRARIFIVATDTTSSAGGIRHGDDVRTGRGADGRRTPSGRGVAPNAERAERGSATRVSETGRQHLDAPGRVQGASASRRDSATPTDAGSEAVGLGTGLRQSEQGRVRGGRPDHDGSQAVSDTTGDRRDERWAEPTGQLGGSDAAECSDELCAECGCSDWKHTGSGFCAGPCGGECTDGGRRLPNSAYGVAERAYTPPLERARPGASSRTSAGGTSEGVRGLVGSAGVEWGPYGPAIRRWECVTGRPAPRPTEPGRSGERLSPRFVEWLMGLPDGWVTNVALARNAKLKALGNGVVPQQASLAVETLLSVEAKVA